MHILQSNVSIGSLQTPKLATLCGSIQRSLPVNVGVILRNRHNRRLKEVVVNLRIR
jgi:hypothetical protein